MNNPHPSDNRSSVSTEAPTVGTSRIGEAAITNHSPPVPTSTTKALLLSISIPRIYRVYIPPKEEPDEKRQSEHDGYDGDVCPLLREDEKKDDTETRNDNSSSLKPHPLLQARDETPLAPDEALANSESSNASGIKLTISKVTTLLVGDRAEEETEGDDDDDGSNLLGHKDDDSSILEHEIGFVEVGDGESGIRHASVTKEEMDMIIKLATSDEQEEQHLPPVPEDETPNNNRVLTESGSMITAASDAIKSFFGVTNSNSENLSTEYLSREEAVAAIKKYNSLMLSQSAIAETDDEDDEDEEGSKAKPKIIKPNTEIKLEELLRLTFRNLYAENHFYNAPIYTDVQTRILEQAEMDDWVELSVMAKQASIGIILERLERIGVGSSVGTIAIYKAELLRTCDILNENAAQEDVTISPVLAEDGPSGSDIDPASAAAQKAAKMEAARAEWKNATSRLRVEQVKEQIQEQAELCLDYLALLVIASSLAGIGLVTDNSVVIVASMLVSPIMGPVMGMTFGTQVSDRNMALRSCWHEFLSLIICVLIGGIIGLTTAFCPVAESFPVDQMSSRGDIRGLLAGIAIAIPSGMGVALSILGNNTSSLVGVAISASLLPPAVNAGICWVFAFLLYVGAVDPPPTEDDNGDPWDFNRIAGISFALTMLNIICIWASGLVMFEIKEVAPTRSKSAFWSRDIKVARAIQKGSRGPVNLDVIKATLLDVIKNEREEKGEQVKDDETPTTPVSSVTSTMKKSKHHKKHNNKGYNFNISTMPVDEESTIVDIGPAEDGRFYSYRDMTHILGLDQDSDEEDEPPPQVRRRFARQQK